MHSLLKQLLFTLTVLLSLTHHKAHCSIVDVLPGFNQINSVVEDNATVLIIRNAELRVFPALQFGFDGRIRGWRYAADNTSDVVGGRSILSIWRPMGGTFMKIGGERMNDCTVEQIPIGGRIIDIHQFSSSGELQFRNGDVLGMLLVHTDIADYTPYLVNASVTEAFNISNIANQPLSYSIAGRRGSPSNEVYNMTNATRDDLLPLLALELCASEANTDGIALCPDVFPAPSAEQCLFNPSPQTEATTAAESTTAPSTVAPIPTGLSDQVLAIVIAVPVGVVLILLLMNALLVICCCVYKPWRRKGHAMYTTDALPMEDIGSYGPSHMYDSPATPPKPASFVVSIDKNHCNDDSRDTPLTHDNDLQNGHSQPYSTTITVHQPTSKLINKEACYEEPVVSLSQYEDEHCYDALVHTSQLSQGSTTAPPPLPPQLHTLNNNLRASGRSLPPPPSPATLLSQNSLPPPPSPATLHHSQPSQHSYYHTLEDSGSFNGTRPRLQSNEFSLGTATPHLSPSPSPILGIRSHSRASANRSPIPGNRSHSRASSASRSPVPGSGSGASSAHGYATLDVPKTPRLETGAYVPTQEERLKLSSFANQPLFDDNAYSSLVNLPHSPLANNWSFFDETELFWRPSSQSSQLYEQLSAKKYREVHRKQIQITQHLGSGEFGTVCKGVWHTDQADLDVAVKMLNCKASEVDTVRFLQEAAIMGQFRHPNVVRLHGVVTVGEPAMIVLELVKNGDLRRYLKSIRPAPGELVPPELPQRLLHFCSQIALGMEYLARKEFVHRDLAARNILVTEDYDCKIADFGLSRDLDNHDYYISQGGRIPIKWTAPEALHFRKYSSASDVWSFGALMYEIWSLGQSPFSKYTPEEAINLVDKGVRLAPPPGCPKAIYHLMLQCWHPEANERPNCTELVQHLSESGGSLLHWQDSDKQVHPQAVTLGAPLVVGDNLYPVLQKIYVHG